MNKKAVIGFITADAVALVVITGIFVVLAKTIGGRPSSGRDVWDDEEDETTFYSRETEDETFETRETQGRDYYENGGYKGWDKYYIIQDLTVEEIIGIYEHYRDLAHSYDINDIKNFDRELEHEANSQIDVSGFGVFMFYDLILPDEKIDHVESFDAEGTESTGAIEFSMKIRIHDQDKAMEIYNTFVERYSEGAQESEFYNMMNTYNKGVWITVDDSESRIVCYKKLKDSYGNYYWIIFVSEDF